MPRACQAGVLPLEPHPQPLKLNLKVNFSVVLAAFQLLSGHMLASPLLESTNTEHSH